MANELRYTALPVRAGGAFGNEGGTGRISIGFPVLKGVLDRRQHSFVLAFDLTFPPMQSFIFHKLDDIPLFPVRDSGILG